MPCLLSVLVSEPAVASYRGAPPGTPPADRSSITPGMECLLSSAGLFPSARNRQEDRKLIRCRGLSCHQASLKIAPQSARPGEAQVTPHLSGSPRAPSDKQNPFRRRRSPHQSLGLPPPPALPACSCFPRLPGQRSPRAGQGQVSVSVTVTAKHLEVVHRPSASLEVSPCGMDSGVAESWMG